MVYVNNDLDNQIVTPEYYLSINTKTGISVLTIKKDGEKADPKYHLKRKLQRSYWKAGRKDKDISNNFGSYGRTTTY